MDATHEPRYFGLCAAFYTSKWQQQPALPFHKIQPLNIFVYAFADYLPCSRSSAAIQPASEDYGAAPPIDMERDEATQQPIFRARGELSAVYNSVGRRILSRFPGATVQI
jgi:hypothetical protein